MSHAMRHALVRSALVLLVLGLWTALLHAEPVIVYVRPDGGVSVVSPSPALIVEFLRFGRATGTLHWSGPPRTSPQDVMTLADAEAAAVAFVRGKDVPAGATDVTVMDRGQLPIARQFRDAWRKSGANVAVNLPAARALHARDLRREIRQRLVKSAEDRAGANDLGNAALAAAHQAYQAQLRALLRSLDADLAALATPEALAAWSPVWPADPGGL